MDLTFWSKVQPIPNKALRARRGFEKSFRPGESLPQGIGDAEACSQANSRIVGLAWGGFKKESCQWLVERQWLWLGSVRRIKKKLICHQGRLCWGARAVGRAILSTKTPQVVDK